MIRVVIPTHLRVLANIHGELQLSVPAPVTINAILDVLESQYPALTGTIRDHSTQKRRPMIRFYACNQDLSHDPTDRPLPEKIASGHDPLYIVAAIAGG
jgi:sulfur-carrier protein